MTGSETPTPPDGEETPDYKAMYEAAEAEKAKVTGQYASLQKKHSKAKPKSKDTDTLTDEKYEELQTEYNEFKDKSVKFERDTLLSQLQIVDKALAEEYKDADVTTLRIVLTIKQKEKSGFPKHGASKDTPPVELPGMIGEYNAEKDTWNK